MKRWLVHGFAGLVLAWFSAWIGANVRLVHPSNGKPLSWSAPDDISLVISDRGSADIDDQSDAVAIRLAVDEWNGVEGSNFRIVENLDPNERAREDWSSRSIHLVLFDEDDTSGWFPDGSGIVALAPILFDAGGRILDADILFNGKGYRFTTDGDALHFDVQDVATHELGHLLGLDHTGCAGAVMHPFVDPTNILHRSLSQDERTGLRRMAPTASFAELTGSVRRAGDDTPVVGAYVVATDADGRSSAGTLTDATGAFQLEGLLPGEYSVTALPLDEPVAAGNLSSWYTIETDFEPATYAFAVAVQSGEAFALGSLFVGDDVSVNLGKASDRYPLRAITGTTATLTVRGNGLYTGGTLTASDPDLIVTPISWLGSEVTFTVTVPADEPPGLVDLDFVDTIERRAFLPGAIEVTPPDPTVTAISPAFATNLGGTQVFVSGTGFGAGARVVIGDRWYGAANGLVRHDANTLELVTEPTELGLHDVVVIDASGVEGRLRDAFESATVPEIASALPTAGSAAGGTALSISGRNFQPGLVVRIDGDVQDDVTLESSSLVHVVTSGGARGVTSIEITNPSGGFDATPFEYVAGADPSVSATAPAAGPAAGGTRLELTGANLDGITEVLFGAGLAAGGTGVLGTDFEVVSATTVRVTTPMGAPGVVDVLLRDAASGRAALLGEGYTYRGASGGGGCSTARVDGPGAGPGAAAWLLVLAAVVLLRKRALQPVTGTPARA
ncbi:MAG: IPT/TIG domain-containing protein [Planctomycetota bacterium]